MKERIKEALESIGTVRKARDGYMAFIVDTKIADIEFRILGTILEMIGYKITGREEYGWECISEFDVIIYTNLPEEEYNQEG